MIILDNNDNTDDGDKCDNDECYIIAQLQVDIYIYVDYIYI